MKGLLKVVLAGFLAGSGAQLIAEDAKEKKVEGHCEKTGADGKVEDIDAKDKKDCKSKGGKWNKAKKGDHGHDHKEE